MVRVFTFEMPGDELDGEKFKMASMSWSLAEKHVKEGQDLLSKNGDVTPNDWFQRVVQVIETSLERADAGPKNSLQYMKDNFDIPVLKDVLPKMYERIMVESGLRNSSGEEKAAQTSPNSAAA